MRPIPNSIPHTPAPKIYAPNPLPSTPNQRPKHPKPPTSSSRPRIPRSRPKSTEHAPPPAACTRTQVFPNPPPPKGHLGVGGGGIAVFNGTWSIPLPTTPLARFDPVTVEEEGKGEKRGGGVAFTDRRMRGFERTDDGQSPLVTWAKTLLSGGYETFCHPPPFPSLPPPPPLSDTNQCRRIKV